MDRSGRRPLIMVCLVLRNSYNEDAVKMINYSFGHLSEGFSIGDVLRLIHDSIFFLNEGENKHTLTLIFSQ